METTHENKTLRWPLNKIETQLQSNSNQNRTTSKKTYKTKTVKMYVAFRPAYSEFKITCNSICYIKKWNI